MRYKIQLGDIVQCRHTGFKGTACSRTEFINGCTQIGVIPKIVKGSDKFPDEVGIDIESLKVISKKKDIEEKKETGGRSRTVQRHMMGR